MWSYQKRSINLPSYVYNGEDEAALLKILKDLDSVCDTNINESNPPLGRIIVAKDFEGGWIDSLVSFYGWSIIFANVARVYIKE